MQVIRIPFHSDASDEMSSSDNKHNAGTEDQDNNQVKKWEGKATNV